MDRCPRLATALRAARRRCDAGRIARLLRAVDRRLEQRLRLVQMRQGVGLLLVGEERHCDLDKHIGQKLNTRAAGRLRLDIKRLLQVGAPVAKVVILEMNIGQQPGKARV